MSHQDVEYIIDAIFIITMILFVSGVLFMLAVAMREPREKTMEPQTVTELRWYLARANSAFNEAIKYRRDADANRIQAILNKAKAEKELAAHATKETKTNLKNARAKVKQADEKFLEADKALLTVHKQKIHLETELQHAQARKDPQCDTPTPNCW